MAVQAMLTDDYDPDFAIPDAPKGGDYHAVIVRIQEDAGPKGEMIVDYEIVAGSTRDQEGKVFRDYFHITPKALGRIHQLAIACGLVTSEQLKDMKDRGQSPVYEFARDCIGTHVCLKLYEEEYPEGSKQFRTKCGFGILHIDDAKTKDIPKNKGLLQAAGIVLSKSVGPAKPSTSVTSGRATSPVQRPTQPAPQQQPVPFDSGDLDLAGVV